jgi:hypothetical protein
MFSRILKSLFSSQKKKESSNTSPTQRANGFKTLAGGNIITFAKEIHNLITGLK